MVRCRNWELQQVCPWGGISAGGDLAETQGFGERSRASLELTECCSRGCSFVTRAAERAWALSALHSPKPHCCSQVPHFPTWMEMTQARSKMMELEAVRCLPSLKASGEWRCSGRFYQRKDFTQPGNSLEAKGSFPPQSPLLWMSSWSSLVSAALFRHH